MVPTLKIGIVGCGEAARYAIVDPVRLTPGVAVAGVASRSAERARRFAAEHNIARYYDSYEDMLADDDIDLVYVGVPTRAHFDWTLRALESSKAVLCEKPLARNAQEAAALVAAARAAKVPLIEGLHYRHHPVTQRLCAIIRSGEIGRTQSIDTGFDVPASITPPTHSRLRFEHAGGATLDPGCYCVSMLRLLTGEEPVKVKADARLFAPNVDVAMTASLEFPGGCTGSFLSALDSSNDKVRYWLHVVGENGTITVPDPYGPHANPVIRVCVDGVERLETLDASMTFLYQLREALRVVRAGDPDGTVGADSVRNMEVIDRIYLAAGLPPR